MDESWRSNPAHFWLVLLGVRASPARRTAPARLAPLIRDDFGGDVVVAVVGERDTGRAGSVGDTVNLAARLEEQADPGQVVIRSGTCERLPGGTAVESLPQLRITDKAAQGRRPGPPIPLTGGWRDPSDGLH